MIHDAIARHAAERPDKLAVFDEGQSVGYGQLARDLAGAAALLREDGFAPGQTVAVECPSGYLHLLLLLACDRLGLVTASFEVRELTHPPAMLGWVDAVLTAFPERIAGARRIVAITPDWAQRARRLGADPGAPAPRHPRDPYRILRTSGTTGLAKYAILDRAGFEARVAAWSRLNTLGPDARILIATPLLIVTMHMQCIAALELGATVLFDARGTAAGAVAQHDATGLVLLPLHLRHILDQAPPGFAARSRLAFTTIGGRFAPALRVEFRAKLAREVREHYSSNESGPVASTATNSESLALQPLPGVAVEIVDERDMPVAEGGIGSVRLRTPYQVAGYRDDPATTARMFRQGWFYPGDLGRRLAGGAFEVLGRADERLNIGGIKFAPEEIEERVKARVAVADVGACAIAGRDGAEQLCVAVAVEGATPPDLGARIAAALGPGFGGVLSARLAAIPRTATGKIRRDELRRLVSAAAAAQAGKT